MIKIAIHNLTINKRVLIDELSLDLQRGSINLLAGPNGSGKSLILDTLFSEKRVWHSVIFQLNSVNIINEELFKKWKLGFRKLYQYPVVPTDVSVNELLNRYLDALDYTLNKQVEDILSIAGINNHAGLNSLSYGQKRVIELIITLGSGKYFFLDEPFAGLSNTLNIKFKQILKHKAASGSIILIIDHFARELDQYYDKTFNIIPPAVFETTHLEYISLIPQGKPSHNSKKTWRIHLFSIEERVIIKEKEVSLSTGQNLLLKGKNGSGKSTLLRSLGSFVQPDYNITCMMEGDVNRKDCFLSPQPPKLIEGITAKENIFLCAEAGNTKLSKKEFNLTLDEHIRYFGLHPSILKRRAESLSGGEASLIALIGSCLNGAFLIFLDEPFENLDESRVLKAQSYISFFKKKIFILSDHNTSFKNLIPDIVLNLDL